MSFFTPALLPKASVFYIGTIGIAHSFCIRIENNCLPVFLLFFSIIVSVIFYRGNSFVSSR